MTARTTLAVALSLWLFAAILAVLPAADPAPTTLAASSLQEAVYFGPAGSVRIRMHISVDGRPIETVWNEAIDGVFAFRDLNGDGGLDETERAPFDTPTRRVRDVELIDPTTLSPLVLTFPRRSETVNRAAFAEALRSARYGPINPQVVPVNPDSRPMSDALFRRLDRTADGRLSPDELAAARERLAAFDLNEDEFVTAAELLGRVAQANALVPISDALSRGSNREPDEDAKDIVFLNADGMQGVKQLLAARGRPRAASLKPVEFGGDGKTFAALDQDGNGALDTAELAAWLRQPPALELAVSFTAAENRWVVVAPASQGVEKNGTLSASLPGGRFRFEPPTGASRKLCKESADALAAQFAEYAKAASPVERKQVENHPTFPTFFDFADRDADGKLTAGESKAALAAAAPLAAARVDVGFVDQGDGLFEVLDRNGDSRLSPRELAESAAVLKPFAGPDGSAGPKDLVRQYQVRVAADSIPIGVLARLNPPTSVKESGPPTPSPSWFAKLDHNGDGDVSLREFVGPIDRFRKLDRNGDGLIGRDETTTVKKGE